MGNSDQKVRAERTASASEAMPENPELAEMLKRVLPDQIAALNSVQVAMFNSILSAGH